MLLAFGDAKMAWQFKKQSERPEFTRSHENASEEILIWGAKNCQLPLKLGRKVTDPEGPDNGPGEWITAPWCATERQRVQTELDRYRARTGHEPVHQEQMALNSETFYSSDEYGLAPGSDGRLTPVPIPEVGCDKF
jgi:hypothetical protein